MSIINALVLSFVQGITEWLPISSSGHLILFAQWFKISQDNLVFDIWLHVASLVVIVVFFRRQIKDIIVSSFLNQRDNSRQHWLWYIILSSLITVGVALVFYVDIDTWRNVSSVSNWFLVTAILLLATKFVRGQKNMTWYYALVLGAVQGFAVLPGLSRSGAVIAVAMLLGIKKSQAFDYAFILAIPAIIGSFLLTISDFTFSSIYLLAFLVTMIVSYATLYLLKLIIQRNYFYLFFIYTLALGLIIKIIY